MRAPRDASAKGAKTVTGQEGKGSRRTAIRVDRLESLMENLAVAMVDGSPGGSGESAVVIDEELLRPTEAGVAENVAAIDDPSDSGPCIHGMLMI